MDLIVERLLRDRKAWVPMPELTDLLPQAAQAFADMLGLIPIEDLAARKYEIHLPDTTEPDDGIFLKDPDKYDPPTADSSLPPDSKIFIQVRPRTERLLQVRGQYRPEFKPFFRLMDDIRRVLDVRIEELLESLVRVRPELTGVRYNREMTVIRVMVYRKARSDGNGLAGKRHLDKNDVTWHLYDSCPGLVLERDDGTLELIPTCPGEALAFTSMRFERLTGVPAVSHGAKDNGSRMVIVVFTHFVHPSIQP